MSLLLVIALSSSLGLIWGLERRFGHGARTGLGHSLVLTVAGVVAGASGLVAWQAWKNPRPVPPADGTQPPADMLSYEILARRTGYSITHPDGTVRLNEIHVPLGRPARLRIVADEEHTFHVEAFRAARLVRTTAPTVVWFTGTKAGSFPFEARAFAGDPAAVVRGEIRIHDGTAKR